MADNFKDKADNWDKSSPRTNGAKIIADAICKDITLRPNMQLMDFGVGTGLLGFEVLSKVKSILGIDTSEAMLAKLNKKNTPELSIEGRNIDIVATPLQEMFDGIISSMTLHHVDDLESFFKIIYKNLQSDGFIAFADLEKEDGTFHSDNTGVFHFGFDFEQLSQVVAQCGFKDIKIKNIKTISKPHRDFGVFLLTARK